MWLLCYRWDMRVLANVPQSLFLAPLRRIRAAMLTKLLRSVPQHAARSWVLDHMPRSEAPWQGTPAAVMLGR